MYDNDKAPDDRRFRTPVLIDVPMPIRTPRLLLRNVMPGDGAALAESIGETLDDLKTWMPWAREDTDGNTDPESREAFVRERYADFILRKDLLMAGFARESGRHVLCSGLHRFDWEKRRFEIGYWVRKSAQGNRYAAEAANALTRYAFQVLGARVVSIRHTEGNDKSRRIIESLGFSYGGTVPRNFCMADGGWAADLDYYRTDIDGLPPLDVRWGDRVHAE